MLGGPNYLHALGGKRGALRRLFVGTYYATSKMRLPPDPIQPGGGSVASRGLDLVQFGRSTLIDGGSIAGFAFAVPCQKACEQESSTSIHVDELQINTSNVPHARNRVLLIRERSEPYTADNVSAYRSRPYTERARAG